LKDNGDDDVFHEGLFIFLEFKYVGGGRNDRATKHRLRTQKTFRRLSCWVLYCWKGPHRFYSWDLQRLKYHFNKLSYIRGASSLRKCLL